MQLLSAFALPLLAAGVCRCSVAWLLSAKSPSTREDELCSRFVASLLVDCLTLDKHVYRGQCVFWWNHRQPRAFLFYPPHKGRPAGASPTPCPPLKLGLLGDGVQVPVWDCWNFWVLALFVLFT